MQIGADRWRGLTLAAAVALGGCSGGTEIPTGWFSKPLDPFGSRNGYSYSQLDEARRDRAIAANDLVDDSGACPTGGASRPAPSAAEAAQPGGPPPDAGAPAPDAGLALRAGLALGMSECDVVARVGRPDGVTLGRNAEGDRTAVLTFKRGAQPGVYRFIGGRLAEMDRVDEPAPQPEKKPRSKKPAKSNDAG